MPGSWNAGSLPGKSVQYVWGVSYPSQALPPRVPKRAAVEIETTQQWMKRVLKVLPTHSRHDPAEFSNQQSKNIVLLHRQFITTLTFIHSTPFTSVLIHC